MTDRLGIGDYQYELVPDWGQLPSIGKDLRNSAVVSGVACDSKGQVYVAIRDIPYPETLSGAILVFDREGKFLKAIGEDLFTTPHLLHINGGCMVFVIHYKLICQLGHLCRYLPLCQQSEFLLVTKLLLIT